MSSLDSFVNNRSLTVEAVPRRRTQYTTASFIAFSLLARICFAQGAPAAVTSGLDDNDQPQPGQAEQQQIVDVDRILARPSDFGLRRSTGIITGTRLSLNGFTEDQIHIFFDGIPIELSGYPFGIANIPASLVQRIDVYRDVLPVGLSADARDGAINLVTTPDPGSQAAATYLVGSFGTHRATATASYLGDESGLFGRIEGFVDDTRNNFDVDVEVPDERGRLSTTSVERFHDAYRAAGGSVELGVVDRSWVDNLTLRAFITDHSKQLQHNLTATIPYGEVDFGGFTTGGSLRYGKAWQRSGLELTIIAGYAYVATKFTDVSTCLYDWLGECLRNQVRPGEIDGVSRRQIVREHNVFGRAQLQWSLNPAHEIRLSVSPRYTTRNGEDRALVVDGFIGPLGAQRDLLTLVSGFEYEAKLFGGRFDNLLFFKSYVQIAQFEEVNLGGVFNERTNDTHRVGVGDRLRFRVFDWLYATASYEWLTRLPTLDELYGDAVLVSPGPSLSPETSHNASFGLTLDIRGTLAGSFRSNVNLFIRETNDLIALFSDNVGFLYQNISGARTLGVEAAAGWTSPRRHLTLDGSTTFLDFRNTSDTGIFESFEGDRIPNRPYFFANLSAIARVFELLADDELSLYWQARFVEEIPRGWQSIGIEEFARVVPSQFIQNLGMKYSLSIGGYSGSVSVELSNLTNEDNVNFFGIPGPGLAGFAKLALTL